MRTLLLSALACATAPPAAVQGRLLTRVRARAAARAAGVAVFPLRRP